jgi:hypothetical protein
LALKKTDKAAVPGGLSVELPDGSLIPAVAIVGSDGEAAGGYPSGTQRTPTITIAAGSGSVAAGAKSVALLNNGAADATILGQTIPPGTSVAFNAPNNDTLAAIAYNGTGTQLIITEVR